MDRTFQEVRPQDLIARVAACDLKNTVKVLRALQLLADQFEPSGELKARLTAVLAQGTWQEGGAAPLHAKPDLRAAALCNEAYALVKTHHGTALRAIMDLRDDHDAYVKRPVY